MAIALYEHACPITKATRKHHERWVCKKCGQQAQFAGWSFGMVGSWGHYTSRYGLRPIGPHRHLADRLLGEISAGPCDACAGRGAQDPDRDDYPWPCPACNGMGRTPKPRSEIARVRAQVLAVYPEMATSFPDRGHWIRSQVLDLVIQNVGVADALRACAGTGLDVEAAIRQVIGNYTPEWVVKMARRARIGIPELDAVETLRYVVSKGKPVSLGDAILMELAETAGVDRMVDAIVERIPDARRGLVRHGSQWRLIRPEISLSREPRRRQ